MKKKLILAGICIAIGLVSLLLYIISGEYHIMESAVILSILVVLMIWLMLYRRIQKKQFLATRSNKMNKETEEYLNYKQTRNSLLFMILVLLIIYIVMIVIGVCTNQYVL